MKLLERDTNLHLLSVLELFETVDSEVNECAAKLDAEIAAEMSAEIDATNVIGTTDAELIRAAERMQNYLLCRYERLTEITTSLGLTLAKERIEGISKAKLLRLEMVSHSNASMSYEEALHGQPVVPRRALGAVPARSFIRVSLR
jgi:hypothetical protein